MLHLGLCSGTGRVPGTWEDGHKRAARAARSILTPGAAQTCPATAHSEETAGRKAERSSLSSLIKATGEPGVWLSGIRVRGPAPVQQQCIEIKCQL